MRRTSFIILFFSLCSLKGFSQKDTTNPQSVDIVSSYRPVLSDAVKINFSGSQLNNDTNRVVAPYNIPGQHLFYSYKPGNVQAMNLDIDLNNELGDKNFIKAGFGNYSTALLKAGVSFGDGKQSLINVYGDYISSKGKVKYQDYSNLELKGIGSYFTNNHEIYAGVGFSSKSYNLYGYDHDFYDPLKKDIRQVFQEINVKGGIKNTVNNNVGINYDPTLNINFFTLSDKLNETSLIINAPAEKIISDEIVAGIEANIDFTRYATNYLVKDTSFNNTVIRLSPYIKFFGPSMVINAGVSPVWNNNELSVLPNIKIEFSLQDKIKLQAGWKGMITKNTVRNLSKINPFIQPPNVNFNTKETEFFGGFKASIGNHFNINATASWITYENFAIFLNDTFYFARNYKVGVEEKMNNFRIRGSISYVKTEMFSVTGGITLNAYTGMKTFSKAWNTVPMEITGAATFSPFKKLVLSGDVYVFGGGKYYTKDYKTFGLKGGTDLSLGAEYSINKNFSAWIRCNNILDDKYERWTYYPVYGLNLLGGIIVKF